ncbi:MAG TPA: hypothetical protein VEW69_01980 [Alphaproteobacteria bacterium]|nr:hypothetical protein [Alphaproteobacteria bacterium]
MLRAIIVFCLTAFVFLLGLLAIRGLRKSLVGEKSEPTRVSEDRSTAFAIATYNSVIQQLKDKEKEQQRRYQEERVRTAAAENVREAVIANMAEGAVFCDPQGILRQANPAAKAILGYASPLGFHVRDIFFAITEVRWPDGHTESTADALLGVFEQTCREGAPFVPVQVDYLNPAGARSTLRIAAFSVRDKNSETLGAVCLVEKLPPKQHS